MYNDHFIIIFIILIRLNQNEHDSNEKGQPAQF